MKHVHFLTSLALASMVSSVAFAGLPAATIYENQTAYGLATAAPSFVETFEFASNGMSYHQTDVGLQSGLSYSGSNLTYFNADFQTGRPSSTQINSSQLWASNGNVLTISFSTAVQAVSLNLVTWPTASGIAGNTIKVTVAGGAIQTFEVSTVSNNPGFFGFVANTDFITEIVLTSAEQTVGVDNIAVSAIPEPASAAALVGLAVLGGVAFRRRRA